MKAFTVRLDGTPDSRTFTFKNPSYKETQALDLEYRRAFSEAVRNGVMTTAEAVKSMKKTGAWTKEDDDEISRRIIDISDKEIKLEKRDGSEEELHSLATDLSKARNELLAEMNKRTELFENTAEGVADQCRVYKMIFFCLRDEKGNRVFDTEEEFESFTEEYPTAISYMYRKAYFFQYDVDEEVSTRWEEVKYLKEKAEELEESIADLEEEKKAIEEAKTAASEV